MFRIKRINTNNCHSIMLVIMWLFEISAVHTVERVDHLHIGICIGPIGLSFGTSIWRKLLP